IKLDTFFQRGRPPPHGVSGRGIPIASRPGAAFLSSDQPAIRTSVYNLRIFRTWSNPSALASADVIPVGSIDATHHRPACDSNSRVVLLGSVDVIRKVIIQSHAVKLRGWLVFDRAPASPAVKADLGAPIIADDDPHRIIRR